MVVGRAQRRRVRLVLRPGRRRRLPHPNAARLWIEHILSDEGALGYLEGGAIPARYATLVENGMITEDMLANLPPAELIEQVAFPTADQIAAAQAVLAENWGPMVADA